MTGDWGMALKWLWWMIIGVAAGLLIGGLLSVVAGT